MLRQIIAAAVAALILAAMPAQGQDAGALRAEAFELFTGTAEQKRDAIALFEQAAEAGDAASMAFLGDLHLAGNGVAADRQKAVEWYLKAVQAGHAASAAKLAELATSAPAPEPAAPAAATEATPSPSAPAAPPEAPSATPPPRAIELRAAGLEHVETRRYADALKVLGEAAELGDGQAMTALGDLYLAGRGTKRDPAAAAEWYRRAVARDDILAHAKLATLHTNGIGATKDLNEATRLRGHTITLGAALLAADPGPDEFYRVASGLLAGSPSDAQKKQADRMMQEAARGGITPAIFRLAKAAKGSEAIGWWLLGAEAGNGYAMRMVAEAHETGDGAEKNLQAALDWYERAADAGEYVYAELARVKRALHPTDMDRAQVLFDEAYSLHDEKAPEAQLARVRTLYLEAARLGHVTAMGNLAFMYERGQGGPVDHEQAFAWNMLGAEKNDEWAMFGVATAYENGWGVPRDFAKALDWFRKAKAAGNGSVDRHIERIEARLAGPPLPDAVEPPTDRWGMFDLDGHLAAGIRSGESRFAFVCDVDRTLVVQYLPRFDLHEDLRKTGEAWLMMLPDIGWMAYRTNIHAEFWMFDVSTAKDWMDAAARTNNLSIGFSPNPQEEEFHLYHRVKFTARGSSAAIRELRAGCV